jgi:hypothetical protein
MKRGWKLLLTCPRKKKDRLIGFNQNLNEKRMETPLSVFLLVFRYGDEF